MSYDKYFLSEINRLKFGEQIDNDKLLKTLSEEEAGDLVSYLMPNSNIYIVFESNNEKYGFTFPMFEDSCIVPSGHRVHISIPNILVLTHELAHILDFDRNPHDCHDDIFIVFWKDLLIKSLLNKEK